VEDETDVRRYIQGPVVCGVRLRGAEATGHVFARLPGVKCGERCIIWVLYPSASRHQRKYAMRNVCICHFSLQVDRRTGTCSSIGNTVAD
jgi:hypothetical protein